MSKLINDAVSEFLVSNSIEYKAIYNGFTKRDNWECDAWKVRIKRIKDVHYQEFDYFTGLGHREIIRGLRASGLSGASFVKGQWQVTKTKSPDIAGVLHSLIMDSSACAQSFSNWCDDYGYDSDSIKARDTYDACQVNSDKLCKVFTRVQIEQLQEMLQDY